MFSQDSVMECAFEEDFEQQSMPRKYILVKEVFIKIPFRSCTIQFIVKKREEDINETMNSISQKDSEQMPLLPSHLSQTMEQYIDFAYSGKLIKKLALYVIAISKSNRVVSVGFIPLDLSRKVESEKMYLKGVRGQDGHLILSMQDESFPYFNRSRIDLRMYSSIQRGSSTIESIMKKNTQSNERSPLSEDINDKSNETIRNKALLVSISCQTPIEWKQQQQFQMVSEFKANQAGHSNKKSLIEPIQASKQIDKDFSFIKGVLLQHKKLNNAYEKQLAYNREKLKGIKKNFSLLGSSLYYDYLNN